MSAHAYLFLIGIFDNFQLSSRIQKLQSLEEMFRLVNVDHDLCQYVQSLKAGKVKIPIKLHDNPDESTTSVSYI